MTILVVDDEGTQRKLLRETLLSEGQRVVEAADGIEALAVLESEAVDAIISDILMPRMDGYQLCCEVRRSERFRRLPFIIYTATYTSREDEQLSHQLGADKYLHKPAAVKELMDAIRAAAARQEDRPVCAVQPPEALKEYGARLAAKLQDKTIELSQAVETLHKSELFSEAVFRSALDCILIFNEDSHLVELNPAAEQTFCVSRKEALGKGFAELFAWSRDQDPAREEENPYSVKGRPRRMELMGRRPNGQQFPLELTLTHVAGTPSLLICFVRDTFELKAAEQGLRDSEARLGGIIASAMDAIVTMDESQRITLFNAAAEKMFQHSSAKMLGQPLEVLLPERFRGGHREMVRGFAQTNVTRRSMGFGNIYGLRANGEEFPIEASISQLERGGKRFFTAILRDITERKQQEEALLEVSRRLVKSQETERRRIAKELHDSTAQDLVAAIMKLDLVCDSLLERGDPEAAQLRQSLDILEHCARDIRTVSYVLHPPRLDESGLAAAIRHYAQGFSERTGIQMELDVAGDLERFSEDEELSLFRVVQECFANIHRHSGSSTAGIRLGLQGSSLVLEVSDKGRGLPPAILAGGGLAPGLGVGIPGMRERLRQIGGQLEIDSGPNGTTVRALVHPQKRGDHERD